MTADEYLTDPHATCELCGVPGETVKRRADPFVLEGLTEGPPDHLTICEECWKNRYAEV